MTKRDRFANPLLTQESYRHSMAIAAGEIPGISQFFLSGVQPAVSTAGNVDVWGSTGLYPFQTVARSLRVDSTDTNDNASGTGARVLVVVGLNSGYDEIVETVPLNGTTPVFTSQEFLRVNRCIVVSAGSNHRNQGTISVRSGTLSDSPLLSRVPTGFGQSQDAVYTVPEHRTAFITWTSAAIGKQQDTICSLALEARFYSPTDNGAWLIGSYQTLASDGSSYIARDTKLWGALPARTDIKFRVVSCSRNDVEINVSSDLVIRDNRVYTV